MHPLFTTRNGFLLYLAAWAPLAALIALWLKWAGAGWAGALLIALPLCLFYAFVCLSTWYVCRAFPISAAGLPRLLTAQAATALGYGGLWLLAATALGRMLALVPEMAGLPAVVAGQSMPLLTGGMLLALLSTAVHYTLIAARSWREAETREVAARLTAREAEFRALKAQVNPHFLFNSLNSISALAGQDARRAREMCASLGDFFRRTLAAGDKALIPFKGEMELARAYLAVERVRFGERLKYEESLGEACDAWPVPPLILQPLIENTIVHGIAGLVEGGVVRLRAGVERGSLNIEIENDFDTEVCAPRGNGTGLSIVRNRIEAIFGRDATMEAGPRDGVWVARLRLPVADEERA